ncbi:MAG TPA: excinuclease ABC subunit UvrA [Pirellulales bacterium]|nr:excinuclease ABC subunit UvrA [Pirellulales bacterium]
MISLRGVAVHNLKEVDLDIPRGKLVVLCGLSGSGKTSLALDTLYAEGQRRYIDSFSAYTRQFLERLEKPAAERIDGMPPAIAVTHKNTSRSNRSTVGTATETSDYLRLLLAKIGELTCIDCGRPVRRETPQTVAAALDRLPAGTRLMVGFQPAADSANLSALAESLRQQGFIRLVVAGRSVNLSEPASAATLALVAQESGSAEPPLVIVDRLTTGGTSESRLLDSLETAFAKGESVCQVLIDEKPELASATWLPLGSVTEVDGHAWRRLAFSDRMRCESCGRDYPDLEPRLFSFNSPLGACPECEGFGNVTDLDPGLIVPDPAKTLAGGAIAPWSTPAYEHEQASLAGLAEAGLVPLDVPYRDLTDEQKRILFEGSPRHGFGGLNAFFEKLERKKYKMHVRVFLSRWRSYHPCPACGGARLRPEALAVRIGGRNLAEISALKIEEARRFLAALPLGDWQQQVGRLMLDQAISRLGYLEEVGLGYLSLDRTLRTLSGGEAQRVALTSSLGSNLVHMLYVLDEPSVGLHPSDIDRLMHAIEELRDRGNTVVIVEHEESMIRAADQVIEIGPGAGERGGQVVFQGTPAELVESAQTLTADFLAGRRGIVDNPRRRSPSHGWIRLAGARGNNLQNITVEFPLGVLCVVTGVSGAGKSTLVQDTLYPALRRRMHQENDPACPYDDVYGDGQLNDVIMVDQSPIGRSPRSNPVTYIKAFDEIRQVFAETIEARTRNFDAAQFSFNIDGGRCPVCQGDGFIEIDMQFLADVYMKCSECQGRRYRREILAVKYRGRNIADVLEMTVREAFTFFRGHPKVQARLKRLIDVGLDYLRLGQPANTLSGGEAQRLKLAGYMSASKRSRSLFLLDEPTTGLHFQDIVQLLDCFDALLAVGHSLIVVEHNLQLMKAADYIVDLGPGAADRGGRVVVQGTPELVARTSESITGRFLREALESASLSQRA